jgi:long-chain acyl-CoA synthetase
VVFADPDSPNLMAVIVPMRLEDTSVQIRIQEFVDQINDRNPGYVVGKMIFANQTFSRESGFLLPNLKLNRKKIAQHFLDVDSRSTRVVARSA